MKAGVMIKRRIAGLKRLPTAIVMGGITVFTWAQTAGAQWTGSGGTDLATFTTRLTTYGGNALMGASLLGGAGLAVGGIVGMANKDHNPQGSQGAWKKVAAGGALMALGSVIGVLKTTMTSSAG